MAVLLSKKKGTEALQLCPNPRAHGDMAASCHRRPQSFDLNYIYKHFTRKPTSEELKSVGWKLVKKTKN